MFGVGCLFVVRCSLLFDVDVGRCVMFAVDGWCLLRAVLCVVGGCWCCVLLVVVDSCLFCSLSRLVGICWWRCCLTMFNVGVGCC